MQMLAFALLGGQELIEKWVLGLGLSKVQFLILSQVIIFLLGLVKVKTN